MQIWTTLVRKRKGNDFYFSKWLQTKKRTCHNIIFALNLFSNTHVPFCSYVFNF